MSITILRIYELGGGSWRDGSAVRGTDHSFRGPRFYSEHPRGGSQLSKTPVLGI